MKIWFYCSYMGSPVGYQFGSVDTDALVDNIPAPDTPSDPDNIPVLDTPSDPDNIPVLDTPSDPDNIPTPDTPSDPDNIPAPDISRPLDTEIPHRLLNRCLSYQGIREAFGKIPGTDRYMTICQIPYQDGDRIYPNFAFETSNPDEFRTILTFLEAYRNRERELYERFVSMLVTAPDDTQTGIRANIKAVRAIASEMCGEGAGGTLSGEGAGGTLSGEWAGGTLSGEGAGDMDTGSAAVMDPAAVMDIDTERFYLRVRDGESGESAWGNLRLSRILPGYGLEESPPLPDIYGDNWFYLGKKNVPARSKTAGQSPAHPDTAGQSPANPEQGLLSRVFFGRSRMLPAAVLILLTLILLLLTTRS